MAVTKIFVSVALGSTLRAAWRASLRRSVLSGSSLNVGQQLLGQLHVGLVRVADGVQPQCVQLRVVGDQSGSTYSATDSSTYRCESWE